MDKPTLPNNGVIIDKRSPEETGWVNVSCDRIAGEPHRITEDDGWECNRCGSNREPLVESASIPT